MQQAFKIRLLIGIGAAIAALGFLIAHELHVNHQTSVDVHRLSDERDKAEQIDRDDKAAIQKIREQNAHKTTPPKQ